MCDLVVFEIYDVINFAFPVNEAGDVTECYCWQLEEIGNHLNSVNFIVDLLAIFLPEWVHYNPLLPPARLRTTVEEWARENGYNRMVFINIRQPGRAAQLQSFIETMARDDRIHLSNLWHIQLRKDPNVVLVTLD